MAPTSSIIATNLFPGVPLPHGAATMELSKKCGNTLTNGALLFCLQVYPEFPHVYDVDKCYCTCQTSLCYRMPFKVM